MLYKVIEKGKQCQNGDYGIDEKNSTLNMLLSKSVPITIEYEKEQSTIK